GLVERDEAVDVDVADAIAVGAAEGFTVEVVAYAADAAARLRLLPGIDQGDLPGLRGTLVNLHGAVRQIEGHVSMMQEIIREVFLDEVTLVPAAHDEVRMAGGGVQLHDVPQNGSPPDFHHG